MPIEAGCLAQQRYASKGLVYGGGGFEQSVGLTLCPTSRLQDFPEKNQLVAPDTPQPEGLTNESYCHMAS